MNERILMGKAEKLNIVWSPALQNELMPLTKATKDDILASHENFRNTKYIFSTWGMPEFSESEIADCLPSLEAVFYAAGSVQRFARPFLARGVRVFSAWAANAVPVSEFVVAEIILANKGFFGGERRFRATQKKSDAVKYCSAFRGNYGATVGIIGCGMIGSMIAERLAAYKLNLLACDPFITPERAKRIGVTVVSLEELFERSDIVTNHVANNPATVGMLTGKLFKAMKPNAVFINTGRGLQVKEAELIEVLKSRPDLTALLDVTHPEPPVADSPFYTLPNVFLTPHIAGSMADECVRMAEYMLEEYRLLISGQALRWEVTEKMLETMA